MKLFTPIILVLLACQAMLAQVPAFPGAEGFGAAASGGRGQPVYYVTNLSDSGPGSLRDAVSQGDRNVLFQVSGTINLASPLKVMASNITIAGQTAPGDGICLRGKELEIGGKNVIVRFLRIRPGDERGEEHDALTVRNAFQVIVDHCSMSWSTDSVNDVVRDNSNVTIQWCIISEPLNKSVHQKGAHGYGTGWGSGARGGSSYHHNLIAHCNSRSPRIGSEEGALVDVRNNVIYNMGEGWAYGGENARINFVANYYRPGPNTKRPGEIFRIGSPNTRMYLRDNFVEGHSAVTNDNTRGIYFEEGMEPNTTIVKTSFDTPVVKPQTAASAYDSVLRFAGAVLPKRDAVDTRVVADVRNGAGKIINSQNDVGGWPTLIATKPATDSDGDGMPDNWERASGLDRENPADGAAIVAGGYTNLEHYLNDLAIKIAPELNGIHHP